MAAQGHTVSKRWPEPRALLSYPEPSGWQGDCRGPRSQVGTVGSEALRVLPCRFPSSSVWPAGCRPEPLSAQTRSKSTASVRWGCARPTRCLGATVNFSPVPAWCHLAGASLGPSAGLGLKANQPGQGSGGTCRPRPLEPRAVGGWGRGGCGQLWVGLNHPLRKGVLGTTVTCRRTRLTAQQRETRTIIFIKEFILLKKQQQWFDLDTAARRRVRRNIQRFRAAEQSCHPQE